MIGGSLNIILKIKYQKWTAKRGEFELIRFHLFFYFIIIIPYVYDIRPEYGITLQTLGEFVA